MIGLFALRGVAELYEFDHICYNSKCFRHFELFF